MRDGQVLAERYRLVATRLRGDCVLLLLVLDANDEADEVFLRTYRGLASTKKGLASTCRALASNEEEDEVFLRTYRALASTHAQRFSLTHTEV